MLLANSPNFSVVGHTQKEDELHRLLAELKPDIVLLDLNLGKTDGFSILQAIRKKNTEVKVLIFTMYDSEFLIDKARQLKANGFLLKNTMNGELIEALNGVFKKDFYLHDTLLARKSENDLVRDEFIERMRLTKRETEIIRMIAMGRQNEEIADTLFLSFYTVKTHRKNLMKKLKLNNAADLVRFAFENKLL